MAGKSTDGERSLGPARSRKRVGVIADAAASSSEQAPLAEGAAILAQPFAAAESEPAATEVLRHIQEAAPAVEPAPPAAAPAEPVAPQAPAAPSAKEPQMDINEANANTAAASSAATAQAQNLLGDVNARAKAAMEKGAKGFEELNEMAKANVEALVEASRIAAKGLESMGQEAAEFGRKNFEQATATMKTLASVKSPTEFFKLQNDYMRGAFDSFVAEASKNTEAMLKLAGDAAQPISNRVAVAADKMKISA